MVTLLNIIHLSDLHLNHPKVSTAFLVNNITRALVDLKNPYLIDRIVLSGDVFDRPTHMDTDAGKDILYFINFLLEFCAKFDIALVVLKGTGNHDGYQSDIFVKLNSSRQKPIDLVYCDKISTWVDRDGYRWLGVPDESTPSAMQTKAEIKKLMKAEGIKQFDFATTHFYYDFHAGAEHNPTVAHDSAFYQKIVKYIIFNGHIHNSSYRRKVLTAGSFDRNKHGEEERKGMWSVSLDNEVVSVDLIVNHNAAKFITYKLISNTPEDITKELYDYLKERQGSRYWLRIAHPKTVNISDILNRLKEEFTDVEIATKKLGEDEEPSWISGGLSRRLKTSTENFTPILPTTIMELMSDKLKRMGVGDVDKHLEIFKELI